LAAPKNASAAALDDGDNHPPHHPERSFFLLQIINRQTLTHIQRMLLRLPAAGLELREIDSRGIAFERKRMANTPDHKPPRSTQNPPKTGSGSL
jgi:hypothetical protein